MDKVIEQVIKLRKLKGLSQRQMAEQLGIAVINYGKYERGETSLTISRLQQISEILNVSINHFFVDQIDGNAELFNKDIERSQAEANDYEEIMHKYELTNAFQNLFYKFSIKFVGGLEPVNPRIHFYNNLNMYLNNKLNESKGFLWFVEFLEIYDIGGIKKRYPDFFNLAQTDNNPHKLNNILHNYELTNKSILLKRLINEWYAYFFSKLYTELFENNMVYTFLKDNEKDFELLADKQIFSLWLEFKKSKEQG